MADSRLDILYLAPNDPLRTPAVHVARALQSALRRTDGVVVRPLLGPEIPEALHGRPEALTLVRRHAAQVIGMLPAADDQVLHVDLAQATQREFWAAQQVLRLRPGCALALLFHDPPCLPTPVRPLEPNRRGGILERMLRIGSFEAFFHRLAGRMSERACQALERAFLERATALLGLSRRAAALLARRYPEYGQKIGYLRPPLLGLTAPDDVAASRHTGQDSTKIACLGRIGVDRAYGDLFDALAMLNAESSIVGLVEVRIWGQLTAHARATGFVEALEQQVEARGLRLIVDIRPGYMSDAAYDDLLAETDIVALPYRAEACQSTSRALLRAASWSVAVVAADVGCIRELLQPGTTGLLYRPGDILALSGALRQLIELPERRTTLAGALRKYALEQHSETALAPMLRAVYGEIAQAHREHRPVRLPDGVRFEPEAGGHA